MACTGGTITTANGKTIHTFTSSGTLGVPFGGNVEVLVVAAGGSGGRGSSSAYESGGGGGAYASTTAILGGVGGSGVIVIAYPTGAFDTKGASFLFNLANID